jgi:hypothetical protein
MISWNLPNLSKIAALKLYKYFATFPDSRRDEAICIPIIKYTNFNFSCLFYNFITLALNFIEYETFFRR